MELLTIDNFSRRGRPTKRRRVVKACQNCRARKVKCDSAKPICSSCQAKGHADCSYKGNKVDIVDEEDVRDTLDAEVMRLRARVAELEAQLPGAASAVTATSVATLESSHVTDTMSSRDTPLDTPETIDQFRLHHLRIKRNKMRYSGPTSWESFLNSKSGSGTLQENHLAFQKSLELRRREWKLLNRPNGRALRGLVHVAPDQLLSNLEAVLPSHSLLVEHIESFFDGIWYSLLPVVHRPQLVEKFVQIFSRTPDDRCELQIGESLMDYAYVALVLIVVKYSLNAEAQDPAMAGKQQYADNDDVLLEFIPRLLDAARYLEKSSMPVLQTLLLMRVYKKFDPRDGDAGDGSKSSIRFALCFQTAIALALHQNIDHLYRTHSPEARQVYRNLWNRLLLYDCLQSFDQGIPLHISDQDLRTEYLDRSDLFVKCMLQLRRACNVMLCGVVTVRSVQQRAEDLEEFLRREFRPIFALIRQYHEATSGEAAREHLMKIFLSYTVASFIQHTHHFLYAHFRTRLAREGFVQYNLGLKYTMLLMISGVELRRRTAMNRGLRIAANSRLWSEANCFTAGFALQGFMRCFVFYADTIATWMKQPNKSIVPQLRDDILIKISSLQADLDLCTFINGPIGSLALLSNVVTASLSMMAWLGSGGLEVDPTSLVQSVGSYPLFILLCSAIYFNNLIDKEKCLAEKLNLRNTKVSILFDVFGEDHAVDLYSRYRPEGDVGKSADDSSWLIDGQQEESFERFIDLWFEKLWSGSEEA